jgi:rhamnose utilization protein RhaD (predicted bifunctional aldolase and dehydrogenase)
MCSSKLKQPRTVKVKRPSKALIAEAALAIHKAFSQATGKPVTVKHFINDKIAAFIARRDAAELCSPSAITPDELIYTHGPPLWLEKWSRQTLFNKLNRRIAGGQKPPAAFLIKPFGLFIAGRKSQITLIKDVVTTSLAIRSFAARLGGPRPLSKRQREFIAMLETKASG